MSSLPPDPYKALGVSKDAPVAEIRSAHRKLVLKCHPDKIQEPELKALKADEFQKVQQAYELLVDDAERQKYDDQVKLAELRRQMQSKANTSSPRTTKYADFEIRTAEPRSSSFKSPTHPPPPQRSKTYHTYSRSWEDDAGRGPRIFEAEIRTSRREGSYSSEKPARKERERERDRDKERDRERRKKAVAEEEARYQEKQAKEARRAEKKVREKARDKEIKRDSEDKKRHAKPYVDMYDEDVHQPIKTEKKKSSSNIKKQEEKLDRERERSRSGNRSEGSPAPPPPPPAGPDSYSDNLDFAASYIEAARSKGSGNLRRAATYHAAVRSVQPPAPTPPPAQDGSAFPAPEEEEVRRSSARSRRGSAETAPRMPREKTYRRSSREPSDDDAAYVINASPTSRHPMQFEMSGSPPAMSTSPTSRKLPRTNTMPHAQDANYVRPVPSVPRSQTFSAYGEGVNPHGRNRSRLQAQIDEDSDDDEDDNDEYERHQQERRYRSGNKQRSPDGGASEHTTKRYPINAGRTGPPNSHPRHRNPDAEGYRYYQTSSPGVRVMENRPSLSREASYASNGNGKFPKVRQSKAYSYDDVQYSNRYPQQPYQSDYPAAFA